MSTKLQVAVVVALRMQIGKDSQFENSWLWVLEFVKIREFCIKMVKFVKIRLAILRLWAHPTGCSGAVPRLINMQQ